MNFARLSILIVAGILPAAIVGSSCALGGFEIETTASDSGVPDAPEGGNSGCPHVYPPAPPAGTGDWGGSIDFTVAIRSIDVGEDKVGTSTSPPGMDLDKLCSGEPFKEGPGCSYSYWATADHTDDEGGRDNAGARLFKYIQDSLGPSNFGSAYYSQKAQDGEWSFLIRVWGYNGQPNDGQVYAAMYPTKGLEPAVDGGLPGPPNWDGNDRWAVPEDAIKSGNVDDPLYVDPNAYVTNNVLVASLPNTVFNLNGSTGFFGVRLTGGTAMATIAQENGQWKLKDGLVAARWALKDVFEAIGMMKFGLLFLCNDGGDVYNTVKTEICKYADIRSDISGPTAPCDAISFGMGFTAEQAQLGATYLPMQSVNMCPLGQDPAEDSCDSLPMPDAGAGGGMP